MAAKTNVFFDLYRIIPSNTERIAVCIPYLFLYFINNIKKTPITIKKNTIYNIYI